ncbi:MAG: hypothetical protein LUE16_06665 [Lachnospiraceae bacterium]|nr:hypothetical protein [Lachnospiraceae bacterium]
MMKRGRPALYDSNDTPIEMFRDYMTMTTAEVARKYDCSPSTVAKYCKIVKSLPEGREIMKQAEGAK